MTAQNNQPRTDGSITRRQFIKLSAATVGSVVIAHQTKTRALAASKVSRDTAPAMLVDLSRCIGCGNCQRSCAEANGLAPTTEQAQGLNGQNFTYIKKVELEDGQVRFVKRQCMHCLDAACVSACPASALHQTPEGPISYYPNRCLGCRYCMVSCPFDIPRFEWENGLTPEIRKCMFCYERQQEGELPACVANCPTGAIRFGTRSELLAYAHARLAANPDFYVDHIYGEHEAGGTAWLYISDVPFESLGFRTDVTTRPIPAYTWDIMSKLPTVVGSMAVVLTGAAIATQRRKGHDPDHNVPPWEREGEGEPIEVKNTQSDQGEG
ncbi:MAG: Formate dehydrogenase, nitrate-inducible, iron-sulfur subunit [Chloroflexi bacterium ADurb.Bin325]|nr:MAG: Formate dehydrogenase, nitrate-inducible, iron-sulfur subunit [Chloroflexi bacterium ADurb.Bin325]